MQGSDSHTNSHAGGRSLSDEAIRERAYYLWEADGRPEGMGDHYWHRAHEEATADFARRQAEGVANAMPHPTDNPAAAPAKKPRAKKADKQPVELPKADKAEKPAKLKAKVVEAVKATKATKKAAPKPRAAVPAVKTK